MDAQFDRALEWCVAHLTVEPVRLGSHGRCVQVIDSSTIARLRASIRCALLGKGYCHRAERAVRANIVAALTNVVMVGEARVGLVRRTRLGASCEAAVRKLFTELPASEDSRLCSVDAEIATQEGIVRLSGKVQDNLTCDIIRR